MNMDFGLAQMPNLDYQDLAVWVIDSNESSLNKMVKAVQTVLPADTDIRTALHPEMVRRELELMSRNDPKHPSQYFQQPYNIFLTRNRFSNFQSCYRGDKSQSFDSELQCIKEINDSRGIFKMLKDYFGFLTQHGSKFFTAFTGINSEIDPDICDPFDEQRHLLNLVTESGMPKLPDTDSEALLQMKLKDMFEHFDKSVSLAS